MRRRANIADEPWDDSGRYQGGLGRSSGLYVDVENLLADGQPMIQDLIENWPATVPAPSRLSLYVRADQVELWRMWSESRFSYLRIVVTGIQHFSMSSKNSADMAIATNAMADLILNRITHVVVFSDDSDFVSLYVAIRDDPDIPLADDQVPFLWVVTNREGALSATVKQFFPLDKLHVVKPDRATSTSPELDDWLTSRFEATKQENDRVTTTSIWREAVVSAGSNDGKLVFGITQNRLTRTMRKLFGIPPPRRARVDGVPTDVWVGLKRRDETTSHDPLESVGDTWPAMAQAILEGIPEGPFKSTDCQPIIKEHWPDHPLANAGGPAFGTEFKNNIWPVLERVGVKITNPGKKPIKYGMTQDAKRKQV